MHLNFSFNIGGSPKAKQLAAETKTESGRKKIPYTPKSVFASRLDIKNWNDGQALAQNAESPRNYAHQLILENVMRDALLYSQVENRRNQVFSSSFSLKKPNGEIDEVQTLLLQNLTAFRVLTSAILDSVYYGYSLCELDLYRNDNGVFTPTVSVLPRTNVVPQNGMFYPDYMDDTKKIPYRQLAEYGTWLLEFNRKDLGLLNRTVSHTLFKRFAQSCWSELCEIFGIPPRVVKTNTQDTTMLDRAEKMMKDTSSAPWFIIDSTEEFSWGQSVTTKGEVFESLITLCNNEISMVISGAIIGQDTKNGNRSKDESAQEILWLLVQSDMALVEQEWNNIILPAFKKIGVIKGDLRFEFDPAEDLQQLWKFTEGLLPYKKIDDEWIKEKFNIQVVGDRVITDPAEPKDKKLKLGGFFD